MRVSDLIATIESLAPPHLAEEWDNVGLIIGSASSPLLGPVLLTIDLTEQVADEAVRKKCSAVIAYHPPLFAPIKRLTDTSGVAERVALRMARDGIAVYSPHTALDAAMGGVTDWLADGLAGGKGAAGGDRRAIRPQAIRHANQEVKIVTFVPESALDMVRDGLATAGAGLIGAYERCSFSSPGTGTFMGNAGSRPAIGRPGKFEAAPELRLEMVCSRRTLALAVMTLKQFHPYEEPAIDIYPLEPRPDRAVGVGRRLWLDHPIALAEVAQRLKKHIGVSAVHIAAAGENPQKQVSCIGIVPGSGGSLVKEALGVECDVFITGEMKHHDVLAAVASGLSVILGGHTATERGYLPVFAKLLAKKLPAAKFLVSAADKDPLVAR